MVELPSLIPCTRGLFNESFGFPSGVVALRPNILWSTPPIQKSKSQHWWYLHPCQGLFVSGRHVMVLV